MFRKMYCLYAVHMVQSLVTTAYAAFTHGVKNGLNYVMKTIPNIEIEIE